MAEASRCATERSRARGAASTISIWSRRANPKSRSAAGRTWHWAPTRRAFMPRGAHRPASNCMLPARAIRRIFRAPAHSPPSWRCPTAECWSPGKKAVPSLPRAFERRRRLGGTRPLFTWWQVAGKNRSRYVRKTPTLLFAQEEALAWYSTAKGSDWASFAAVRGTFPDADLVSGLLVFNIRRNRYRLIVY